MSGSAARWPAAVALFGATMGLVFAALSSLDYVKHLDRQVHGIHCSILPGAALEEAAESGCRSAMYSPYSALLKDEVWGGIPIGLFAVGAFCFFIALSLYLLLGHNRAPRRSVQLLALSAMTPLLVSLLMASISLSELGTFCQTCVGIYLSSAVLAAGGLFGWLQDRKLARGALQTASAEATAEAVAAPRRMGGWGIVVVGMLALGLFALAPAALYFRSVPSYEARVIGCGKLIDHSDPKSALLHIAGSQARQPVTMLVDPLCPTCKGFHERLVSDGYFEAMNATVVLFPLDSECNWNLSTPLHPGACAVSSAVLCVPGKEREVLEWAYSNQVALLDAAKGKDGAAAVLARIEARWPNIGGCLKDNKTRLRLDEMIRFATRNQLPVSTPQLFIGDTKLCDEDVDIGLTYALKRLAPALAQK